VSSKYKMTISRLTVDKLGVRLYDRVSAVIAEIVANSYDADATEVEITAPMDEMLATKAGGVLKDKNYLIEVTDNGIGMLPEKINPFYLTVGAERRKDAQRGDTSKVFGRKVMGRKGVGKLAPFGICQIVEVISSGGKKVSGKGVNGVQMKGYLTAHLILDRSKILKDTDTDYFPAVGPLDGKVRPTRGTTVRLRRFDYRRVPTMDDFERQLAQRFGIATPKWRIRLIDSLQTTGGPTTRRDVGSFAVDTMDDTKITFGSKGAVGPDGKKLDDVLAGFDHEGRFYPITGWVGYSKLPYKDDLMAGVRIYCRGKIAAQTHIFNLKAGFTGEYDIRSYLVGELHADWLDETVDLIRTDRQDILWSQDLGQAFEAWGRALVKKIGALTREPKRKRAWERFQEVSKIDDKLEAAFPDDNQKDIRENAIEIAKVIAKATREESFDDPAYVESMLDLSILLGPHITLDRKLREAAESIDDPLSVINGILRTARIAELAGFGKIADDRVKVIKKIELLKDDPSTLESAFQSLIAQAPWLINPQWAPITANQKFSTLKGEFAKYYKKKTGKDLVLLDFAKPNKAADFVLSNQDNALQIIEIKKPAHSLTNVEMGRINTYVELMKSFLDEAGNAEFRQLFPEFRVTLVCDKIGLTGVSKTAFAGLVTAGMLEHINWKTFLLRTRRMHEQFLNEAERQRKNAANKS